MIDSNTNNKAKTTLEAMNDSKLFKVIIFLEVIKENHKEVINTRV